MLHVRLLALSRIPIASRLACRASLLRRFASSQAAAPAASLAAALPTPLLTPEAASGIQLREYQEECIQAVLSHLRQGHKRLGISLATGSGKTVIFTHLIERIEARAPGATRTLIITHRRELVEQAARHCMRAYPSKLVEIEMGNIHATGTADITVASVRSLCSGDRLCRYDARRFKLVLVDEAHHIVAPSYMDVLEHFGLKTVSEQSPALVGVSATLSRFDGLKIGAALDHIVYHKDYVEMIEEKWLANVIFTTVRSTADLSRVGTGAHGDFRPGELSRALNTPAVNDITVRTWLERTSGDRRRHSTLVFCADISHVVGLADAFRQHGVDARTVTGATPPRERSATLDAFRARRFPVLVNCGVFTEGTDIPGVDCVVLARPTRSRNLLVQMIGRGMRLHPGKADCHVIDMVASLEAGVVTTPTLFGLDPDELLDAAGVEAIAEKKAQQEREEQMAKAKEAAAAATPAMTATTGVRAAAAKDMARQHAERQLLSGGASVTLTDYESVEELIGDTAGERHIRALSPNAWVRIGPDRYILKASSSGHSLTIVRRERDGWYEVIVRRQLSSLLPPGRGYGHANGGGSSSSSGGGGGGSDSGGVTAGARKGTVYARPVRVGECETFLDAVHAADTYASALFPRWCINKHERWRLRPATTNQIAFLNRLSSRAGGSGGEDGGGGGGSSSSSNKWSADTLTKGKAMDMITKIIHGARGWFDVMQSGKRRELREHQRLDKTEALKLRERVAVGPVAA